jgi:predicted ribonuclease toxin of YeeF-YezG toxin-antitoxin module
MDPIDVVELVLIRAKVPITNPYYAEKYRAIKEVEHLFPGEGYGKSSEILSYLKRWGYEALTEDRVRAKYQSTELGPSSTLPLF